MKLKPITAKCACGKPADRAVLAVFKYKSGVEVETALPVCGACVPIGISVGMQNLPSHEPVTLKRSVLFPPSVATWFTSQDGSLTISCPQCARVVRLPLHLVDKGNKLKPSFICPHCDLHLHLTLED